MKLFLVSLLMLVAGTLYADYLLYETASGKIISHDKALVVTTDDNGAIQTILTKQPISVGSTTNDMNTVTYTNISQLVLVPLEAKDVKADFDGWRNDELRALCKVLLDEINILRVKAGLPERTATQFKTAIKNKL